MNQHIYGGEGGVQAQASDKERLAILGTSLFAPEVVDLAEETGKYEVVAFIENWDREKTRRSLLGLPVIWIDEAAPLASMYKVVCALGTTHRRGFIEQAAAMGFTFATIIHPGVRLSTKSSVGEGSIVSVGTIIAAHTTVGRHVIINRGCLIGHHTTVHDYVTLSPGANVAGAVSIGEGTYIGMGAIVLDHLNIGSHAVIGAGSVVTRDVPDRTQVMGIPAKVTQENVEGR